MIKQVVLYTMSNIKIPDDFYFNEKMGCLCHKSCLILGNVIWGNKIYM